MKTLICADDRAAECGVKHCGWHHTKESRDKQSKLMAGRRTGSPSQSTRDKLKLAALKQWAEDPNSGFCRHHHSEKSIKRMQRPKTASHRESMRRRWADMSLEKKIDFGRKIGLTKLGDGNPAKRPEVREKIRNNILGRKLGPRPKSVRDRIGLGNTGKQRTVAHRERASLNTRAQWARMVPEERELRIRKCHQGCKTSPTEPEQRVGAILSERYCGKFKYNGNGPVVVGGRVPDFVSEGDRQIVEVWGDYWHRDQDPQALIDRYKQCAWEAIVIWERETRDARSLGEKIAAFCDRAAPGTISRYDHSLVSRYREQTCAL